MDTTWLDGVVVYARVTLEVGAADAAVPLLRLLAPFDDHVPYQGLTANPPVAAFLGGLAGLVGRHTEAEAYFAAAAALNGRGGMQFAESYSSLLWARTLLARDAPGDRARAVSLLTDVRWRAAAHGYVLLERRAEKATP